MKKLKAVVMVEVWVEVILNVRRVVWRLGLQLLKRQLSKLWQCSCRLQMLDFMHAFKALYAPQKV